MKNTNFMAPIKAFFSKAWTATKAFSIKAGKWIIANKMITIPVAVVLVGGIACAIALPTALHEHDFATEWSSDAENHWHSAICSHEEEKSDLGAHAYDNACDTTCNVCGATRTVGAHVYDNACDTTCNTCGAIRTTTHDYATTLTAGDTTHYYLCSVCGDKKDEVAHVFDKTVASSEYLKAEATATTKAQYYKSCVCGKASATEYFETDKTTGTLANIQDLSKTYDKVELANPTYETNSNGAVTIEWYQGDTKLDAKPVNVGTYKVKVIIAESATYTGISAEKEFTIAKVIVTIPTLEKEYDGYDEFEFVFEGPADEEIDCVVEIGNKNAGAYVDEPITYKSVSSENYEITATAVNVLINKRPIYATGVKFAYDGSSTWWSGEEAVETIVFENVAPGETVDYSFVEWTFSGKGVGSTLSTISFQDGDDGRSNYEIDITKCSASIVAKVLDNVKVDFEYNTYSNRQKYLTEEDGIVEGDEVFVEVNFESANANSTVLTGEDAPYLYGDDRSNYVLGSGCEFNIVRKKLTLKAGEKIEVTGTYNTLKQHNFSVNPNKFDGYVDTATSLMLTATTPSKNAGEYTDGVILTPYVGNSAFGTVSHNYDFSEVAAKVTINPLTVSLSSYVKVEYNGTSEFTLATPFDLTSANTGGGQDSVSDRDEVYITWIKTDDDDIDITEAIDYTLGGADAGNYDIDELGVEITKKKLTNLHLYITSDTYESGEITLIAKDGVVAGEVVKISITDVNDQDFGARFSIFMELEDGTSPDANRYETVALVASGDSANYELATYDDGSGNQVVGIVEGVASCDVQYDGSCNCGTSHLAASVTSGEARLTAPCATAWESGIYKLTTTAEGYWSIRPSDNFCNIDKVYDKDGNEVEYTSSGFYASKNTYYVHISRASASSLAQTIQFTFANTLANLEGAAAKSDLITAKSGGAIYFRIEEDTSWGGELRIYSYDGVTLLDESDYTLELLDESFNKIAFTYEYPDISSTTGTLVGRAFYIAITLNVDTNVQVEVV